MLFRWFQLTAGYRFGPILKKKKNMNNEFEQQDPLVNSPTSILGIMAQRTLEKSYLSWPCCKTLPKPGPDQVSAISKAQKEQNAFSVKVFSSTATETKFLEKVSQCRKTEMETFRDFSTSIQSQNIKKLKGAL